MPRSCRFIFLLPTKKKVGHEAAKAVIKNFQETHPSVYADVQKVADQIDHVV